MSRIGQFFLDQRANYSKWDFLVFATLTLLSVLYRQTTIFNLIYFFWWNELIRIVIDRIFYQRNPNAQFIGDNRDSIFSSLFIMGIYFVFIVVFFGFIAASNNTQLLMVNMKVLFLQNWFFNINIIFILIERIYLHRTRQPLEVSFGGFTRNMVVLHVSIILGGILMFFVVKNFSSTFTPENLWGSVIIILPFLLLRRIVPA